jgi:hypothetical protein
MVNLFLNVATVLGSYFFMLANFHLTPRCYDLTGPYKVPEKILCSTTSLCHCTFPLLCIGVALVAFAKNMYDARLYYECLIQGIMLDFDNDRAFTNSWAFGLLAIYGAVACAMPYYQNVDDSHDVSLWIYQNMAYISPLISFMMVLGSTWQVENQLIALPKFCETDPEVATAMLSAATYVPEEYFRIAFERSEAVFADERADPLPTDKYFAMLKMTAEEELASLTRMRKDTDRVPEDWAWWEKILAKLGLPPVMSYIERNNLNPSEAKVAHRLEAIAQHTGTGRLRFIYWVSALLHSSYLKDERSTKFRRWAIAYLVLSAIIALFLARMFIGTTVTVLWRNHVIVLDPDQQSLFRSLRLVNDDMMDEAMGKLAMWRTYHNTTH